MTTGAQILPRLERLAAVKDAVAVAGVGDTDYADDYRRDRAMPATDAYGYAARAFVRALDDCGIDAAEIDGLIAGPSLASERLGEILGLDVRWAGQADAANAVIQAVIAIHAGVAECIALVYGNDQRSGGTAYGGPKAMGGERYLAYVYYAPWGFTSQGAIYAMMANRYMHVTGFRPADLAEIVVAQRRFAALNPNAIMRAPITAADYMASRVICDPLHLFDYCLVNDGGVALILTTAGRARRLRKTPVLVSGIARSDMNCEAASLKPRLIDFYRPAQREAAEAVYAMAGAGPGEIDLLQIYDSFSLHVPLALEGFGFCAEGEAARLIRETGLGPGGGLPTNTSGGHLSESYMQGWNHQVEAIRQLRGETGARQVEGAATAQYIADVAGKVASIIYRSGI